MLQDQGYKYEFAKNILGDNIREWTSSSSDKGGFWYERILPMFVRIAATYDSRAENGDSMVSDLLTQTKSLIKNVEDVIVKMNEASSILALPVQAATRTANPARISLMATMLSLANKENNMRKTKFGRIEEAIDEAIRNNGNIGKGGFDVVVKTTEEIYRESWNNLKFNFINFENYREHKKVYPTLIEMNSDMQRMSMSNHGGLESLLGEDFN